MAVSLVSASTQYVVLAASATGIYQNVTGATLMGWASLSSTPLTEMMIVHFSTGASTSNARLSISYRGQVSRWRATARRLDANSASSLDGTSAPAIGTIHHVCAVAEFNAQILRIYVNGVQENTLTIVGWTGSSSNTASQSARIGATGIGASYFNGSVTDVRTYNRALSANEVATIYGARGKDSVYYGMGDRWKLAMGSPASTFTTDPSTGPNQSNATGQVSPVYAASNLNVVTRKNANRR